MNQPSQTLKTITLRCPVEHCTNLWDGDETWVAARLALHLIEEHDDAERLAVTVGIPWFSLLFAFLGSPLAESTG